MPKAIKIEFIINTLLSTLTINILLIKLKNQKKKNI